MAVRFGTPFLCGLLIAIWTGLGQAQVDACALGRSLSEPVGARSSRIRDPITVVIDLPSSLPGLRVVAPGLGATEIAPEVLAAFGTELRATWSAPARVQMDQATRWTRAEVFRQATGQSGQGAVVGIVDTGVDALHPDLCDSSGRTRVAWYLDLGEAPLGLHPDLETEYGCDGETFHCAVLSGEDIDARRFVPADAVGHGTHLASLAAGGGARYPGIAPEVTLIAVRATRGSSGTVLDADALLATRFVFDRAADLAMPAVVNLSLGTDFGAHDGSSRLEQGLARFVGPDDPGRVVVVAAGNSGTLYTGLTDRYPEPLGIHTEVHVPEGSSVRVPVVTPRTATAVTRATLYLWVAGRPGDRLEIGFDDQAGRLIDPVAPGHGATHQNGDLEVSILNGIGDLGSSTVGANSAAVVVDGAWPSGASFALRLAGRGTARLWVQSEGELSPALGSIGALFPRAMRPGTLNLPASDPMLIAVGATVNRTTWVDREGAEILDESHGRLGTVAVFSAGGPNALGDIKPDLLAPGALVIGAMSRLADPASNGGYGLFEDRMGCGASTDCLVVDAGHAVAAGTSMAAPIVAGAAALLLAVDPDLTQDQVRGLLQAGCSRPSAGDPIGFGGLDLDRTLQASIPGAAAEPAASESFLVLADDYAHPDPDWVLRGAIALRTATGHLARGVDPSRLRIEVSPGRLVDPVVETAPALLRFGVVAEAGTGGDRLRLRVVLDGHTLIERVVPIAVDRSLAEGEPTVHGGCSLVRPPTDLPWLLPWAAVAGIGIAWRRYRRAR